MDAHSPFLLSCFSYSMNRPHSISLNNALRPSEESGLQLLMKWEEENDPWPRPQMHFYGIYPYNLTSYHAATEAGTLYRNWQVRLEERERKRRGSNSEWMLSMMDVCGDEGKHFNVAG